MNLSNVKWRGHQWEELWSAGEGGPSVRLSCDGSGAVLPPGDWCHGARVIRCWPTEYAASSFVASDGTFLFPDLTDTPEKEVGRGPADHPSLSFCSQGRAFTERMKGDILAQMTKWVAQADAAMVERLKKSSRPPTVLEMARIEEGYCVHVALLGVCDDGTGGCVDDWLTPYEARTGSWVGKPKGPLARVTGIEVLHRYDHETFKRVAG